MTTTPGYKALLFDMDGLLVNSEFITYGMWVDIFRSHGYDLDLDGYCEFLGKNEGAVRKILEERFPGLILEEHIWPEWDGRYEKLASIGGIPLKKGALELLDYCDEHGIKMAVCSSNMEHWVSSILKGDGVYHRFFPVLDGSCVKRSKPAPDLFLKGAEMLGISPEDCLVLEDSNPGILAGHAAGMDVCCVPDLKYPSEECISKCTYICEDLSKVIGILEGQQ